MGRVSFLVGIPILGNRYRAGVAYTLGGVGKLVPGGRGEQFRSLKLRGPVTRLGVKVRRSFVIISGVYKSLSFRSNKGPIIVGQIVTTYSPILISACIYRVVRCRMTRIPCIGLTNRLKINYSSVSGTSIEFLRSNTSREVPMSEGIIRLTSTIRRIRSYDTYCKCLVPTLRVLGRRKLFRGLSRGVYVKRKCHNGAKILNIKRYAYGFRGCIRKYPPLRKSVCRFLGRCVNRQAPKG